MPKLIPLVFALNSFLSGDSSLKGLISMGLGPDLSGLLTYEFTTFYKLVAGFNEEYLLSLWLLLSFIAESP